MTAADSATDLVNFVAERLRALVPQPVRCVVAVSGGPDSLALLDLLHRGIPSHHCDLVVAHVDHGLHPASGSVARLVEAAAAERGLECRTVRLDLPAGASETRARVARRAALAAIADSTAAGAIVLAHHADDQAETVLMRVLRGSGPAGLAAMAPRQGRWVRPLLDLRRAQLAAYVVHRGLTAWIDPANADPRHLRSWLRAEVLPGLAERLPDVVDRLLRTARLAGEARAAWNQLASELPGLDPRPIRRGISVAAPVLAGYRSALRRAVLAALGRRIGVALGARRLGAVERLLAGHSDGKFVSLARDVRAELSFRRLTLYRIDAVASEPAELAPGRPVDFGGAHFDVRQDTAATVVRESWRTALLPGRYLVRGWQRGDRIHPLSGGGSRAVAVLLREARVPRSQRPQWPVVVREGDATVVWVPGICRSDVDVPAKGTDAWVVECVVA